MAQHSNQSNSMDDDFLNDWNPPISDPDEAPKNLDDSLDFSMGTKEPSPDPMETAFRPPSQNAPDPLGFMINGPPAPQGQRDKKPHKIEVETAVTDRVKKPLIFPKLGEAIGGFRLISELGRGAFARVYLAHEITLGNRPVALKVSRAEGEEPQILARLQHTHIVPIHSLFDDPVSGLRLICMPFVGGANLAQLLEAAGERNVQQSRGRSLLDALDLIGMPLVVTAKEPPRHQQTHAPTLPCSSNPGDVVLGTLPTNSAIGSLTRRSLLSRLRWNSSPQNDTNSPKSLEQAADSSQPARRFLSASTYVQASAWIMARLAEGLEHAHQRNLLHRDIKPSNILVAADGTPMLLDFNLATDAATPDEDDGEKAKLGGTLPYMAPEHLDAFNPRGKTSADAVDERSDLYALGLILFEMLAGTSAFSAPPEGLKLLELLDYMSAQRRASAPSVRSINPEVPWSLDAIVAKCLDAEPSKRYRSAGELAEDLRRFLADQPLKFTKETSLRETVSKWARRHPKAASASTIIPVAAGLLIMVGALLVSQTGHLLHLAARLNLRVFHDNFQECQFLLNTSSGGNLTGHLKKGLDLSQTTLDRYGVTRNRDWEKSYWVASLTAEEQAGLKEDMAELLILRARAAVTTAQNDGTENDRRKAIEQGIEQLNKAESITPQPLAALYFDRSRYYRALGLASESKADSDKLKDVTVTTCRDEYLFGTAELAAGEFDRAERRLTHAASMDPERFWAWFSLGICHFDQRRFSDAVTDFTVCTVLMPKFAWPHVNRGHALARAGGRLLEAEAAFEKAIELSPTFTDALIGRGLVRLELNKPSDAEADFKLALDLGSDEITARLGLAEAWAKQKRIDEAISLYDHLDIDKPGNPQILIARGMTKLAGDPKGAEADFLAAIDVDPRSSRAHLGLARISYKTDQAKALKHVDIALSSDPFLTDALQLRALIHARMGNPAAINDVDRLLQTPSPHRLYNGACAMALLAGPNANSPAADKAIALLNRAIATGFSREIIRNDHDFTTLKARSDFQTLIGSAAN